MPLPPPSFSWRSYENPEPHKSGDEVNDLKPLISKLAEHRSTPHWTEASRRLGPHAQQAVERLARANADSLAETISGDFHIESEEHAETHTYDDTDVAIRAVAAQAVLSRFSSLLEEYRIANRSTTSSASSENDLLAALVRAHIEDGNQDSGDRNVISLVSREATSRLRSPNSDRIGTQIQKHLELFRVLAEEALQLQSNEE